MRVCPKNFDKFKNFCYNKYVKEKKELNEVVDDDYDVIIGMKHNYPMEREVIGGVEINEEYMTVKLMNS